MNKIIIWGSFSTALARQRHYDDLEIIKTVSCRKNCSAAVVGEVAAANRQGVLAHGRWIGFGSLASPMAMAIPVAMAMALS